MRGQQRRRQDTFGAKQFCFRIIVATACSSILSAICDAQLLRNHHGKNRFSNILVSRDYQKWQWEADGVPEEEQHQFLQKSSPHIRVHTMNLYAGVDLSRAHKPNVKCIGRYVLHRKNIRRCNYGRMMEIALQSNFPERAKIQASFIRENMPDIVTLQEVAKLEVTPLDDEVESLMFVSVDFLGIFLDALGEDIQSEYEVAGMHVSLSFEATAFRSAFDPSSGTIHAKFTLSEVLLVRRQTTTVNNVLTQTYQSQSPQMTRGFVAADVTIHDRFDFMVVGTHLEPESPRHEDVQLSQVEELVGFLAHVSKPILLLGEINSDPSSPGGRSDDKDVNGHSNPYAILVGHGMQDLWLQNTNDRAGSGYTGVQSEMLDNPDSELDSRLDYVFYRPPTAGGISLDAVALLESKLSATLRTYGPSPDKRTAQGLWPSNHASLYAELRYYEPQEITE